MLDRKIAPLIHPIKEIKLPNFESIKLNNGIPCIVLKGGSQKIIKFEIVFKAGRSREKHRLVAKACAQLLKEGTANMKGEELAEKIDFFGSSIACESDMDRSTVSLYCIQKHFEPSFHLLFDILVNALFEQEEIDKYGSRSGQRLQQQLSKNSVLAYRKLSEEIFGESHPYGYNTKPEDYQEISRSHLLDHFDTFYQAKNCEIYISGAVDSKELDLINQTLGSLKGKGNLSEEFNNSISAPSLKHELSGNKLQTSIKIGKKLYNRLDPEYYSFVMLNTVLGGYFGSRLMSSIREEKGYTYSIYSMVDSLEYDGSFYISTEVGQEYYDKTIVAIDEEFSKLKTDLIGEAELGMAKNYMLGNFLSLLDGPLKSIRIIRMLNELDKDETYFNEIVEIVRSIQPSQIRDLAVKHLDLNQMIKVAVGDF